MDRPTISLEVIDTFRVSDQRPLLKLQMPTLQRGASVLSMRFAFDRYVRDQDNDTPFYVDPRAQVIVILLRAMAPSAEGTGDETFGFIIPIPKLHQLIHSKVNANDTYISWESWGPSCASIVTLPDCVQISDWLIRQSVNGFHFAYCAHGIMHLFNVNPSISASGMQGPHFINHWSPANAPIDSWVFEDIIRSEVKCWKRTIDLSTYLSLPSPDCLLAISLMDDYVVAIVKVTASNSGRKYG
jgi:hypothetical protein